MINFLNTFNEFVEKEGLVCCDIQKDGPYRHESHLTTSSNAFYVHKRKRGNGSFRIMININLIGGQDTELVQQLKNIGFTVGCSTGRHTSELVYEHFNPTKLSDAELKIVLFALRIACDNYKLNNKIYC